jgi:hypothetical protein
MRMGKRLSDNLSSLYLGAANKLKPKKAKRKIVAYVESYDDVAFWRSLFDDFEDEDCYFEVMLPSKKNLCKGKKSVLMNDLGARLGVNMVACVDSDYDYLLQQTTSTSRQINNSRFVFQTYAYAIENFQCYAGALHEACVLATMNDRKMVDVESFMSLFSQIAYPLFVWSVWFYRKGNLKGFSMTEFNSYVRLDHVKVTQPEEALMQMDKRVKNKLRQLENTYPYALDEIEAMKAEFTYLGVTPETTYMFIQGHHIMESVVIKLLAPICSALRREREEEIKRLAVHHLQYKNEMAGYEHRVLDIDVVLSKHTGYKDSPLYQRIENDVREFLNRM